MTQLAQSLSHSWEPFILIIGLLMIGHSAAREGLFEFIGGVVARTPGSDLSLFVVTMIFVAIVTALLNLDTSVVFMTPVALHAARTRNADETPFLYGTILMSNSASLLLLGSNLTNLLVFASRPVRGSEFASHMLLAWLSSVIITIGVVAAWRFRELRRRSERAASPPSRVKVGPGLLGVVLAVVAMLALSQPALPVLAIGLVLELLEMMVTRRAGLAELMRVVSPIVVGPLFVIAVLVGWLGRSWHAIGNLVAHTNSLLTALVAGAASLLINNLPAASLFAGQRIAHPYALLLGLNLGPNAFVTGAMSTMLWFRLVRRDGASPSVRRFVLIGIPVTVLTMAAAVALV